MANIKHMEMANAFFQHPHIIIEKSLFGLKQTVMYQPTKSIIDAYQYDYTSDMGRRIENLLESPIDKLESELNLGEKIERVTVGNIRLEGCVSRDHQFAAVQLFHYHDLAYHSITKVKFYEGKDAEIISKLF